MLGAWAPSHERASTARLSAHQPSERPKRARRPISSPARVGTAYVAEQVAKACGCERLACPRRCKSISANNSAKKGDIEVRRSLSMSPAIHTGHLGSRGALYYED